MNKVICHDIDGKLHKVNVNKLIFRPSVYGVLIEKGKILLLKQKIGYDFPGGGMELGETLEQTLKREFFEETGLKVEPLKVICIKTDFFHPIHSLKHKHEYWNCQLIYFLVKRVGGKISKDNFSAEEKEYADLAEWIDFKKVDKIKIYSGIADSKGLIKEAANLSD